MREFIADKLIISFTVLMFLGLIFILIDGIAAKPEPFYGVVIDNHYKPESDAIGVGYGTTTGGRGGVVVTTEHESEKYLLVVRTDENDIVSVECNPELYYSKKIGDRIECNAYKGFFTGITWSTHGSK